MNRVKVLGSCTLRDIMLSLDGSYDPNSNGRDGADKDDAVDDFVVNLFATLEGLVD